MSQTQLDKLKMTLGISDDTKDAELGLILDDVQDDILTWTNRTELPKMLESTVRQIAVIRYNMQGIEGQTSHAEGGISRSFDSLTQSIQNTIIQYRLLKAARYAAKTT
ncbi:phage head-tail connector protein [Metasolibacillus meyeri]|uniref:Phage head-tail connector protein n=1 Tax=Metasolibacillus meyeri TaxID=1071052 RepID=A0AAW9NKC7_9BACL|nr:phage head-tail connector protein [Metasolibacillus meyeri]MEC1177622.1 phage head-tail connector protein [Metasolibacillus meyeri]